MITEEMTDQEKRFETVFRHGKCHPMGLHTKWCYANKEYPVQVQLSLEANPVLDTEYAPAVVAAIKTFLDTVNPQYRSAFVCSGYVFTFDEETGYAGIRQISPQVKTVGNASDDNISTGGNVGSGGWRPEDVSDPGNGPENQ